MSNSDTRDDDHLQNVPDGAGCTEIWETLSEQRDAAAKGDEPDDSDEE